MYELLPETDLSTVWVEVYNSFIGWISEFNSTSSSGTEEYEGLGECLSISDTRIIGSLWRLVLPKGASLRLRGRLGSEVKKSGGKFKVFWVCFIIYRCSYLILLISNQPKLRNISFN
jgi:hypothetical protein